MPAGPRIPVLCAIVLATLLGEGCAVAPEQPCQIRPADAGSVTINQARALYEQSQLALAAGTYAALEAGAASDVDLRLAALAGQARALSTQACDDQAMATWRRRSDLAMSHGRAAAYRESQAQLARLQLTRDSRRASELAEALIAGAPADELDTLAMARLTLAALSITRGHESRAEELLAAARDAPKGALTPLTASDLWRTTGVLRKQLGQHKSEIEAAFQQAADAAARARDPGAQALAELYLTSLDDDDSQRGERYRQLREKAQSSHMRRVEAVAERMEARGLGASFEQHRQAVELLGAASTLFGRVGDLSQQRLALMELANVQFALGDYDAARDATLRQRDLARQLALSSEEAKAWQLLGTLAQLQPQPDWELAVDNLQWAKEILCALQDPVDCANVRYELALARRGRGDSAEQLLRELSLILDSLDRVNGEAAASMLQTVLVTTGWTLLKAGRDDEAAPLLRAATRLTLEKPAGNGGLGQAWWGLARIHAERSPEIALVYYQRAVAAIDPFLPRGKEIKPSFRQAFAERYAALYHELAIVLLKLNRPDLAHQTSQLWQEMDLIENDWRPVPGTERASGATQRVPAPEACELEMGRRNSDYLAKWTALVASATDELHSCCAESEDARSCPEPRDQARQFCRQKKEVDRLRKGIRDDDEVCMARLRALSRTTQVFATKDFQNDWARSVNALRDVTLVVTLIDENQLHLLVRGPATNGYRRYSRAIASGEIEGLVDRWRIELERKGKVSRRELDALRAGLLSEMYQLLFASIPDEILVPAVAGGTQKPVLVLALDGPLRDFPLAALYDGRRYLIEKTALALLTPQAAKAPAQSLAPLDNSLVVGMSKLADPQLNFADDEVLAVSDLLDVPPMLDETATRDKVKRWVSNLNEKPDSPLATVLHIAAHSKMGTTPKSLEIKLAGNGALTGQDFMAKDDEENPLLKLRLVVLSICESAQPGKGDLAMGLAGIASQGTRSVVGSLWRVDDSATAELMTAFYRAWIADKRSSVARALASAQMSVSDSHPHPYFWADFVLLGRWD